jgi:sugar lactone lactonase YvrE
MFRDFKLAYPLNLIFSVHPSKSNPQQRSRFAAWCAMWAVALFSSWNLAYAQTKMSTTTTLAVSSASGPVTTVPFGTVVTLTASVKAGATAITVGQVNFCDASVTYCTDIHLLGTSQLTSAGTATIKFRPGVGSHGYKAVFVGANTDAGSESSTSALTVTGSAGPFASAAAISESGSFGTYTLGATVTEAGQKKPPTRTVSFLDSSNGNSVLATGTLGAAVAGIGWPTPGSIAAFGTRFVLVADLNGDGIPDLVVNNVVYLGNANGTYTALSPLSVTGSGPMVVADLNGDGIPDLVLAMYASSTVSILLGNGDGTFAAPLVANLPPNVTDVSQFLTADFNGDGITDLAVVDTYDSALAILLGNGDGTFTIGTNPPFLVDPSSVATGDFNGDGKADLAVADSHSDAIAILLGNGDGTFTAASSTAHSGTQDAQVAAADFNGDGKLDLAVAAGGNSGTAESVTILTGNGDGTFNSSTNQSPTTSSVTWIQVADFNQDGAPDVVVADSTGSATVFLNGGGSSFSESYPVFSDLSVPYYLMVGVGDLNGDGYPDIVAGGYYNNTVGLYLTEPTETATATANVTIADAGQHLVDASYGGDGNYNSSVSGTTPLWGVPATTTTSLTLTSGGSPVTSVAPGTVVTLTATVKAGTSLVTSGQVNFCDATASHCTDIHIVGTASLTGNGTATLKFVPGPGTHSYFAEYIENGQGAASDSSAVNLTVGPAPAPMYADTTSITVPGAATGNYTLTATVAGFGGPAAPTGTVSFLDTSFSNTVLATAQLGGSTAGLGWLISQTPALSSSPISEVTGDFNGDGKQDLALLTGSAGQYTITVLLGNGDGTFSLGPVTQATGVQQFQSMVAGEFNGDGHLDLAITSNGYYGTFVTTLLGSGDGSFGTNKTITLFDPQSSLGNQGPESMVTADFNGDGILDLAFMGPDEVVVALGVGDGTFTLSGTLSGGGQGFEAIASGDFNGDGIPDLVAIDGLSGDATVFLGKGDGTFSAPATLVVDSRADAFLKSVVVGDFNGDGVPDLAFSDYYGISTCLGNGDGTFKQAVPTQNNNGVWYLVTGDFNQDGKLDVAGFDDYTLQIDLFQGAGDGTFTMAVPTPSVTPESTNDVPLMTADFNGDGVPDLALFGSLTNVMAIFLTEPAEVATATVSGIAPVGAGTHNVEASYAGDSNYPASVSGTVPLTAGLAPLVIKPASGIYNTAQTVTITESIPGSTIYYQASGILNTNGYVQYTGPIQLNEGGSESITAYASEAGYNETSSANVTYTINLPAAPAPTFSPAPGSFAGSQQVTISDTANHATIYYTTDGSTPNFNSAVYSGSISVTNSEALVAIAIAPGYSASAPATASYYIDSAATRFIYSVAGDGAEGYSGDGGPATFADLDNPKSAAIDSAGNIYISDTYNNVVRKVAAGTGIITTIAGNTIAGYTGDSGPATSAELNEPGAIALDAAGNLYIADLNNSAIRKIEASTGVITTFATNVTQPGAMAVDSHGNLYFSAPFAETIREVSASTGAITTVAGSGGYGYSGDGGPALSADFIEPSGIALDANDNLYIADTYDNVIREVNSSTKIISTVAGNGHDAGYYTGAFSGDGGPATSAELYWPSSVAVDGSGNLYIADFYNQRIREVNAATKVINTIAGDASGFSCYSPGGGDGGAATSSALCFPNFVSVDGSGNVFVLASTGRVQEITAPRTPLTTATAAPTFSIAPGTYAGAQTVTVSDSTPGAEIYILLGGGTATTAGEGYNGPINVTGSVTISAIAAAPGYLRSAATSAAYTITTPPTTVINSVAGNGKSGFSGVGGPALSAELDAPADVALDSAGDLYIADPLNYVVWKVAAGTGTISLAAGTGIIGATGNGGLAIDAQLYTPQRIAVDSAGNLYIADSYNYVVRKVDAITGIITVYAGNGTPGYKSGIGDGGPATQAQLGAPAGLAFDSAGDLYISDSTNNSVRMVSATTGIITTVAGNGATSPLGDGGPALSAAVPYPGALALDSAGDLFIATPNNGRVRKVAAGTGIISTAAGNGNLYGGTGDGGLATDADVTAEGLAVDAAGNLYIASSPDAIRKVDATTGLITRFAGDGYEGYSASSGDGGAATVASICYPEGMAFDASGNLYFAANCDASVREVSPSNPAATPTFSPVAGTYTGAQSVKIMDGTTNSNIYYTTDGSIPTTRSTQYAGAISVSASETINAIAVAPGYTESAVASAAYVINQPVTPTITWPAPAAMTYGTALSATQLDATASIPGTFVYSPAAGTLLSAGQQALNVTFTPTDAVDYTIATATVTLQVNQATPTITWSAPAAITYGEALSASQLDATSSVQGTFVYSPAAGTLLTAGQQTLSVTFTPNDAVDYTTATASVTLQVNQATPAITWSTPAPINYGTALTSTQLDATASVPGSFVYSPAVGAVPPAGSDTLSVAFTPTDALNYTKSTATVTLVVNPFNPTPGIGTLSPAFAGAGGAAFTLTVNGTGFVPSSIINWGTTALTTQYVNATQLTAEISATSIASTGVYTVTVETPSPGGGTSNSFEFDVDTAGSTPPSFTTTTVTVSAGSSASYSVTLPSSATNVSVQCLNLPSGTACSYSASTGAVTITTSSSTPAGTYQIVVVFTETLPGAATAMIFLPILLLPLLFMRRRLAAKGFWFAASLLLVVSVAAVATGCGGGGNSTPPPPQTHQVTSSGTVTLTVQ